MRFVSTVALRLLAGSVGLALLASSTIAKADPAPSTPEQTACASAYEDGDKLANHSTGDKLIDARARIRVCAAKTCPDWMVKDCTDWLTALEARIPTVIFEVKDDFGEAITNGQVAADERVLEDRIDGRVVEMNPGEHEVTFTLADGRTQKRTIVLHEGEKRHVVGVTFPRIKAAPPSSPAEATATTPAVVSATSPEEHESPSSSSPLRTVGYIAGGVGIVGLGIGIGFGVKAIGNKSDANCNANNVCQSGPLSDAKSAATLSTVGIVAGGVLLGGGILMILLSPSKSPSTAISLTPSVAKNEGGLLLRGVW